MGTLTEVEKRLHNSPSRFNLIGNYPNPFNPTTTIQYAVNSPGQVIITIYNSLGQEVCALLDEYKTAGEYTMTWDGKDDNGVSVASGTYFYQMRVGDFISAKKAIMLK